jgi:shikimate kinase
MKKTGKMICLSASADVILKRTSKNTDRPLLNVKDPRKRIEHLLKLRAPYYALADKTIDTSGITAKKVAQKIVKLVSPS